MADKIENNENEKPVKKKAGLKKGMCNNLKGRPKGALNKASTSVKSIISEHFLKEGELSAILSELKLSKKNNLDMEFKIATALKYLRFISSFPKDGEEDGEDDEMTKIRSIIYNNFNITKNE